MITQARLGPGRIHHCMRSIGMAERALELMCRRALRRGRRSASRSRENANIQDWIAEARIEHRDGAPADAEDGVADGHGRQPQARVEIAAIKVAAPQVALKVIDRAIQVHGGGGRQRRLPAGRASTRTSARCASPTGPTRCTSARSPGASCVGGSSPSSAPRNWWRDDRRAHGPHGGRHGRLARHRAGGRRRAARARCERGPHQPQARVRRRGGRHAQQRTRRGLRGARGRRRGGRRLHRVRDRALRQRRHPGQQRRHEPGVRPGARPGPRALREDDRHQRLGPDPVDPGGVARVDGRARRDGRSTPPRSRA